MRVGGLGTHHGPNALFDWQVRGVTAAVPGAMQSMLAAGLEDWDSPRPLEGVSSLLETVVITLTRWQDCLERVFRTVVRDQNFGGVVEKMVKVQQVHRILL